MKACSSLELNPGYNFLFFKKSTGHQESAFFSLFIGD